MSTKIAVVTGSNKGIGFAIIKGLCEKFAGIVYLTARDITRGQNAVKDLEKLGFQPKFHQLDINDQSSIDNFKNHIENCYGGIDILVNNAAIMCEYDDSSEPFSVQAEKTIAVNYFSLLRVCKTLFPLLRPQARVINLSSFAGHLSRIPGEDLKLKLGDPNLTENGLCDLMNQFVESAKNNKNIEDGWGKSAYVVSKVGASALSFIQQRTFDEDPKRLDVIVNAVHPGYVDTDMTKHKGHLTIEQGADAALYLALESDCNIKGCFIWFDRQIVDWRAPCTPPKV